MVRYEEPRGEGVCQTLARPQRAVDPGKVLHWCRLTGSEEQGEALAHERVVVDVQSDPEGRQAVLGCGCQLRGSEGEERGRSAFDPDAEQERGEVRRQIFPHLPRAARFQGRQPGQGVGVLPHNAEDKGLNGASPRRVADQPHPPEVAQELLPPPPRLVAEPGLEDLCDGRLHPEVLDEKALPVDGIDRNGARVVNAAGGQCCKGRLLRTRAAGVPVGTRIDSERDAKEQRAQE
mmetsp:Transcript_106365/g.300956  ORF Transcript_106365/g.300956 Transcript_106365/m.300956 type:complete len:234 (-) Transcript_106365:221-922(-)